MTKSASKLILATAKPIKQKKRNPVTLQQSINQAGNGSVKGREPDTQRARFTILSDINKWPVINGTTADVVASIAATDCRAMVWGLRQAFGANGTAVRHEHLKG